VEEKEDAISVVATFPLPATLGGPMTLLTLAVGVILPLVLH
jgi:hypothetical protein